jgi:Lactate dehydrogenase and related dehydrogenases
MCRPKVFVTRALLPEAVELLRSRCEVEMGPKTELDQKDLCQAVRGVDAVLAAYLRLEDCVLEAMAPTAFSRMSRFCSRVGAMLRAMSERATILW